MSLPYFEAMRWFELPISGLRDFTRQQHRPKCDDDVMTHGMKYSLHVLFPLPWILSLVCLFQFSILLPIVFFIHFMRVFDVILCASLNASLRCMRVSRSFLSCVNKMKLIEFKVISVALKYSMMTGKWHFKLDTFRRALYNTVHWPKMNLKCISHCKCETKHRTLNFIIHHCVITVTS